MKTIIIAIASALPLAGVEAGKDNVFTASRASSNDGDVALLAEGTAGAVSQGAIR